MGRIATQAASQDAPGGLDSPGVFLCCTSLYERFKLALTKQDLISDADTADAPLFMMLRKINVAVPESCGSLSHGQ